MVLLQMQEPHVHWDFVWRYTTTLTTLTKRKLRKHEKGGPFC